MKLINDALARLRQFNQRLSPSDSFILRRFGVKAAKVYLALLLILLFAIVLKPSLFTLMQAVKHGYWWHVGFLLSSVGIVSFCWLKFCWALHQLIKQREQE